MCSIFRFLQNFAEEYRPSQSYDSKIHLLISLKQCRRKVLLLDRINTIMRSPEIQNFENRV